MKKREPVAAADLFVLIDREFRRRKRRDCAACFAPFPYRVERGGGAPNWEISLPAGCGNGCDLVLEELAGELRTRYEIKSDER